MTPAHVGGPLFAPSAQFPPGSVKGPDDMDKHRRALYMLLGQDFDVVMEAHADAYQQARKKWSECSVEEWTQGADGTSLPPLTLLAIATVVVYRQSWQGDSERCSTLYAQVPLSLDGRR